jgi:hypothetical protein
LCFAAQQYAFDAFAAVGSHHAKELKVAQRLGSSSKP